MSRYVSLMGVCFVLSNSKKYIPFIAASLEYVRMTQSEKL